MRVVQGFVDGVDTLISWLSNSLGQTVSAYCDIETCDIDRKSIVAQDGSLITIMRLNGSRLLVGPDEFNNIVRRFSGSIQSYMGEGGHMIQVYFIRDPDGAQTLIENALLPARNRAKEIGLDFSDIFDDQEAELRRWVSDESCYLALWTRPQAMMPAELREARAAQAQAYKQMKFPLTAETQDLNRAIPGLRDRHHAFINALATDMQQLSLSVSMLNAHDALRAIRESVDPVITPEDWRPALPGDPMPARWPRRERDMASSILWPPIASQIFPRDAMQIDYHTIEVGDRIYAPIYIDIPPQEVQTFLSLFQRTLSSDVPLPWRISYLIEGGGLKTVQFKRTMATILSWASGDNGLIRDAVDELEEWGKVTSVIKLRIALTTWAPKGNLPLLRSRTARLAKAVVGWGNCEIRQSAGDPLEAFVSTTLATVKGSVATPCAAPLSEVVKMLPIARPTSDWNSGAVLFSSSDGKLMPYQPGSTLQQTWISLFFAGPGSGKSVLMNMIHKATCLAPSDGGGRLPRVSIIDIGPSSSGLISLIKSALPSDMQHMANYYRLRMTPEFAFNPFDTQLGCRIPLPEERAFLVDFLVMLSTPAETGTPAEGLSNMVGLIIDEMYKGLRDDDLGRAHEYSPNVDVKVDRMLESLAWDPPQNPTWWEVVDFLFQNGKIHEAALAQRRAVPILADAASAARSDAVRDIYGKLRPGGPDSETLPEMFSRIIQESVREFPILSQPTQFDIGDSRVTALDLDEVAKSGGPQSNKRTAIVYMLASYALSHDFTLTKENLTEIPEAYRSYHNKRIHEMQKDLKTICYDEFHRTGAHFSAPVRERVKVQMREGRKWNVQVMLASQQLRDFDDEMISMATNVYMMQEPAEQDIEEISNRFGLSTTETMALRHRIRGPGRGGGTFFARISTKNGIIKQLLRNPAGAIELWAFSTSSEDKVIRERVYAELGPSEGRRALARAYPGGTARPEAEARKEKLAKRGQFDTNYEEGVYEQMADEVIQAWRKNPGRKVA